MSESFTHNTIISQKNNIVMIPLHFGFTRVSNFFKTDIFAFQLLQMNAREDDLRTLPRMLGPGFSCTYWARFLAEDGNGDVLIASSIADRSVCKAFHWTPPSDFDCSNTLSLNSNQIVHISRICPATAATTGATTWIDLHCFKQTKSFSSIDTA